jgi:hypothetical protein
MRGSARSSVNDGGTGTGVQSTFGSGFGLRLTGTLGFGAVAGASDFGTLGGLGTLLLLGSLGICLPLPGSIPIILAFLSSMTATESAPVFFAANVKLLGIGQRLRKRDASDGLKPTQWVQDP